MASLERKRTSGWENLQILDVGLAPVIERHTLVSIEVIASVARSFSKAAAGALIGLTSVEPWIFGNVPQRNDRMNLAASRFGNGVFPEGERVLALENVFGPGWQ